MKSSLILGLVFLLIGGVLLYIQEDEVSSLLNLGSITGFLLGAGIGLLLGALIGYFSKSSAIKKKNAINKNTEKEKTGSTPTQEL